MPARPLTFIQGRNLSIVGQRYFCPRRLEDFEISILSISFAKRNYFDKMIGYELELKVLAVALTAVLSEASILFSCTFQNGTCGMENQPGLRAHWRRSYLQLGGHRGYAMAITGNDANNHFARFMTPTFSTGGSESGCLTFDYFIDGRSPASLACIKQGYVTGYLFATARKTQNHWAKARVDVQFLGDELMLYFEADTRVQEYGNSIVAFTNLQVTDQPCVHSGLPHGIFRS